ncbi:glycoside hydrolase family 127 protein [Mucilaginibacter mali]|uniref:Glycoside hydrolase family 127 protein n=1 Tax=Mucilaginibacter mali TaxID=2740462 RepID=A0A7D4UG32_9SPHI|nr:beta-L-arabinofuranosidase domain-containing protein [Mucilaginibacter mali]QKJ31256.1 glycoside hydrolase family 127 protein [Mucilaginibacter mali]
MTNIIRKTFATLALAAVINGAHAQGALQVSRVSAPANTTINTYYLSNRAPLQKEYFARLPIGSVIPGGWLKHFLELQRSGLTGHLDEISKWLSKTDNAWINKDGKGKFGWEELPYWLKGYANIGYMLHDPQMIAKSKFWIDAVLNNQRPDGDFGPVVLKRGKRDLWTNMPMLWCLISWYEYSHDARVVPFMTRYFKWELSVPDNMFLKDYWENSRGGDNLVSVYWLYNKTGDSFLLDLAAKIDHNTANWRQADKLPNWHNVNIAESFREPAQFYQQSNAKADLDATYNDFKLVRDIYGQVPGGMFGADENARKGYNDPRQAVETCGMVEQMTSNQMLLPITGDTFWADNTEDVAFNTYPAAFEPDYRALRYLTAPNMVFNDSKNHSPGIANDGPFLMMNPFSSRCCQHNHAAGWVYYAENSWMATPDNGLAAQLYFQNSVKAKVGNGKTISISQNTQYPFSDRVAFTINTAGTVNFPLYLRVPNWCDAPKVQLNGKIISVDPKGGGYIRISNNWHNGDRLTLILPMNINVRQWEQNKNSVSVNYGPLTYSLKIKENYIKGDSKTTAMDDSGWQEGADANKWPSYEIHPGSDWNYGLVLDKDAAKSFTVVKKKYPADNNPFINANAPIELKVKGKQIAEWGIDQYGLAGILPQSPVVSNANETTLTLVPMGGARLRISAFPVIAK